MKYRIALYALLTATTFSRAEVTPQEYDTLLQQFTILRTHSVFPVHSYDSFSSSFGPRIRASTMAYDWHRGLDISGTVGDPIVAPLDGIFWRYTEFANGGFTLILRHDFPQTVSLNGYDFDHFYSFYLHLFDDEIPTNGLGTDDIIDGWIEQSSVVTQNQHIASLGESGSTVSPHLHFELRLGLRFSHEFQIENTNTFNYGFDPHMHPMLLFEPYAYGPPATNTYTNQVLLDSGVTPTNDLIVMIQSSNDDMPLLNRFEVFLVNELSQTTATHVLDYNLRTGFVTTNNPALDLQNTNAPYIEAVSFGLSATNFRTFLVIPTTWLSSNNVYSGPEFTLEIKVYDIWQNQTSMTIPVPELRTRMNIHRQPMNNVIKLAWESVPGQSYHLAGSTNLVDWQPVPDSVVTAKVDQLLLEVPYIPTNGDRWYFRTVIE